jgi:biopolymer transport protein ExbD
MAGRRSLAEEAGKVELNLTSLIDAVFLLLIFFMVTTVFVKSTALKIELPDAVNYDQIEQEKKLNLRISSEGKLEINSRLVGMGELGTWIRQEKFRTGSTTLIITADDETPHGYVIDAMEVAVGAGVEKIDLETEEPGKGDAG